MIDDRVVHIILTAVPTLIQVFHSSRVESTPNFSRWYGNHADMQLVVAPGANVHLYDKVGRNEFGLIRFLAPVSI